MKCSVLCDVSTLLLQAMLQVASYTSVMHCLVRQFIAAVAAFVYHALAPSGVRTDVDYCYYTVQRLSSHLTGRVAGGRAFRVAASAAAYDHVTECLLAAAVSHTHNCCIFGAACRGLEIYVFVNYMYM